MKILHSDQWALGVKPIVGRLGVEAPGLFLSVRHYSDNENL